MCCKYWQRFCHKAISDLNWLIKSDLSEFVALPFMYVGCLDLCVRFKHSFLSVTTVGTISEIGNSEY